MQHRLHAEENRQARQPDKERPEKPTLRQRETHGCIVKTVAEVDLPRQRQAKQTDQGPGPEGHATVRKHAGGQSQQEQKNCNGQGDGASSCGR